MLHFFRLLLLLINIDQETVLNWFGTENPNNKQYSLPQTFDDNSLNLLNGETNSSSSISLETLGLIFRGLIQRVQDGLTLADIENILFFILFIRFIILAIRYNLKTSFYITSIGLFAGYLWYRHLIDLISMYRSILIKLPYLNKLGAFLSPNSSFLQRNEYFKGVPIYIVQVSEEPRNFITEKYFNIVGALCFRMSHTCVLLLLLLLSLLFCGFC